MLLFLGAEIYAGVIRIILWSRGQLDSLQQDMAIKNLLFITTIYGAYSMWMSVKVSSNSLQLILGGYSEFHVFFQERYWNDRDLGMFGWQIPSREAQLEIFRYSFVFFYLLEGLLLTIILMHVSDKGQGNVGSIDDSPQSNSYSPYFTTTATDHFYTYVRQSYSASAGNSTGYDDDQMRPNGSMMTWLTNFGIDICLCIFFLVYCKNVHRQSGTDMPRFWLLPQRSFILFPGWLGTCCILTTIAVCNNYHRNDGYVRHGGEYVPGASSSFVHLCGQHG
jgi:hypothetical protein